MELKLNDSSDFEKKRLKSRYRQYFSNYSLLITLGTIWLIAGSIGNLNIHLSIFAFITGITLIRPLLSLFSKMLRTDKINKGSSLKMSVRMLMIGIAFGVSTVFFPFMNNINLFYPSFNVITGLIFISIAIAFSLRIYFVLGISLIAIGVYLGLNFPESFYYAGIVGGMTMIGAGIINGIAAKFIMRHFKLSRKKFKAINLEKTISKIAPKKNITENI